MKRALVAATMLFLALPAPAFARGEFDPTTEFEQHEWVSIHLGPLNLSITKAVVYLMLGTVAHDPARPRPDARRRRSTAGRPPAS